MSVSEIHGRVAANEVEVGLAVDVPQSISASTNKNESSVGIVRATRSHWAIGVRHNAIKNFGRIELFPSSWKQFRMGRIVQAIAHDLGWRSA